MNKSTFQFKVISLSVCVLIAVILVGLGLKKTPAATEKSIPASTTTRKPTNVKQAGIGTPAVDLNAVAENPSLQSIKQNETIQKKLISLLENSEMKAEEFDVLNRLKQALGDDTIGQVAFDMILLQIAKRNKIDVSSIEAIPCTGKNACELPVNALFKTSLDRLKTNGEFLVQRHLLLDELATADVASSEKLSLIKNEFLDSSGFERDPQSAWAENGHASLDNYGQYALINQERLKNFGESDRNVIESTYQYIMQSKDTPTKLVLAANLFRMYPAQAVEIGQSLIKAGLSEEEVIYAISGPDKTNN